VDDKNDRLRNICKRAIYACDVGTTRPGKNGSAFAWAKISPEEASRVRVSDEIERLVSDLGQEIQGGRS